MEHREIGKSGISVSVIGLGCWQFAGGGYWGESGQDQVNRIVHEALDLGIDYFDTAEAYGRSEELLGEALRGKRNNVILSTKRSATTSTRTVSPWPSRRASSDSRPITSTFTSPTGRNVTSPRPT